MAAEIELLAGDPQNGESDKAAIACNDWLRLGPGRSLPVLLAKYSEPYQDQPPTRSLATLKGWSRRFGWASRSAEFDANWEALKSEERAAELGFGLANDYERVRKLKRLADFLEAQIYELSAPDPLTGRQVFHNVWLPDVKSIGYGDLAERVDIERFNSALFTQYRETLNDLAKEVGGRVQKQEVTGADGGALTVRVVYDDAPPLAGEGDAE